MAQSKANQKKSNNSRQAAVKKTTPKRTYKKRTDKVKSASKDLNLKYEIVVMCFVAISLFLILSIYIGLGGVVGNSIRNVSFGIFGISAYILPVYILIASIYKAFNRQNKRLHHKLILVFLLLITISTIANVYYIDRSQINQKGIGDNIMWSTLAHYFSTASKNHAGGGFIGGFFGDLITMLLGKIGSIIILVLISISLLILLTEQSFFKIVNIIGKMIHGAGKKTYEKSKDIMAERQDRILTKKQEEDVFSNIERQERINEDRDNFLRKSTLKNESSKLNEENEVQEVEINKDETIEQAIEKTKDNDNVQISFFKEKKEPNKLNKKEIDTEFVNKEIKPTVNKSLYEFPPLQLLNDNPNFGVKGSKESLQKNAEKLEKTLSSFGVNAKVINISYGPTVTRYEIQPEIGVKVSRIVNLSDDIALNLAASGIRMEAPIPGKSLIGIEVPNKEVSSVYIKEVIDTQEFKRYPSKIAFALGKDISGETIIADIARMPHMLISGATGSGKSVCINTLITSILYKASPNDVKLLMIDPKVVELKVYNGIPHLLIPVVTDAKKAAGALYWAVQEMSERYQLFANANVRDLNGYNSLVEETGELNKLPQIVIIVDELADLMQVASKEVEDAICRLAQMARAAGIHLILATQRPSVDVITGLIKANVPSRIAFAVSSGTDSRTIIDMNGAEKLVGKGDMLYYPVGMQKPIRVQGAFISDKEVEHIVEFLKASQKAEYDKSIIDRISSDKGSNDSDKGDDLENDSYFDEALALVIEKQKASASMIQRRFRVGYNRAARIIDQLHDAGFIGPEEGSKPRRVLITMEEYYQMKHQNSEGMDDALAAEELDDLDNE